MSTDYDEFGGDGSEEMTDAELNAYEDEYGDDNAGEDDGSVVEEVAQQAYAEGVRAARQSQRYDADLDAIEDASNLTDPEAQTLVIEDAMQMAKRSGIAPNDAAFPSLIEQAAIARRGDRIAAATTRGRFRMGDQR
jgi:hypothetical protein